MLPIKRNQISAEIIAGITLAAIAIPEVMGYTKISGTPVITGLYTILIPMALFALFVVILAQSAATSRAYAARYNEQQLSQEIADLTSSSEPALRWFCIEASAVDALDYSAAQTLRSIDETLKTKGIRLVIAQVLEGINPGSHYELDRLLGKNALYKTTEDVIKGYKLELDLCRGANETGAPHKNKG